MTAKPRRRLLVDPELQCGLVLRVLFYWTLCVFALGLIAGLQVGFSGESLAWDVLINRTLFALGPSLVASLILLPILLLDALRFSHRFAGPMKRLRNETRRLAEGNWDGPVQFREGDYWHDLAAEINRVAARIETLEQAATQPAEQPAESC